MHQSTETDRLLEIDIKTLTLNYLRKKNMIDENSIIMNELTVGNYLRRVDLAILSKGKLIAFEIKSVADSMYRLEGQVDTYLKYFDKVIVVSDSKFIPKMRDDLPKNVGLWEVRSSNIEIQIKGRLNDKIQKDKLIDYMDVVDLSKLSSECKLISAKNRSSLKSVLIKASNKKLREGVEMSLNRKFRNSSLSFLRKTTDRDIVDEDLKLLSRFTNQREKLKIETKQRKDFWKNIERHAVALSKFANSTVHVV